MLVGRIEDLNLKDSVRGSASMGLGHHVTLVYIQYYSVEMKLLINTHWHN